jgi:general secretion pathway protein A
MYEDFFGLREKPFSLTADPRFFYPSGTHVNALQLIQEGLRQREGLVVITGTSGTGKTTVCRRMLEDVDRATFTSLILNPYVLEDDLLRIILQDFGVISRDEGRTGCLSGVHPSELLQILQQFLMSLRPLGGRALVIVDEAQKLPLRVFEQIKQLSALAVGRKTMLQIVLAGQPKLTEVLRAPEMGQLDRRVRIRHQLRCLSGPETSSYVRHRLLVAGDGSGGTFTDGAVRALHRAAAGNPRLINLLCDRAMLATCAAGAIKVDDEVVLRAAHALGLKASRPSSTVLGWMRRRVAAL